jgi:hypothetical protein
VWFYSILVEYIILPHERIRAAAGDGEAAKTREFNLFVFFVI